jgi:hypothetical protein
MKEQNSGRTRDLGTPGDMGGTDPSAFSSCAALVEAHAFRRPGPCRRSFGIHTADVVVTRVRSRAADALIICRDMREFTLSS